MYFLLKQFNLHDFFAHSHNIDQFYLSTVSGGIPGSGPFLKPTNNTHKNLLCLK